MAESLFKAFKITKTEGISVGEKPSYPFDDFLFSFFFQDEVSLDASGAIPVLAAATLLQLDGLIRQCSLLMRESVNLQTVLPYYEAATTYGVVELETVGLTIGLGSGIVNGQPLING